MAEETEQEEENAQDGNEGEEEEKSDLQKEEEAAEQEVAALEDDPPQDLEDWPDGDAKYKTFGGPDAESGYSDGPTQKLGDADVRHHEDGTVTVAGEEVDNPEEYKGDPIPGGPTDPNSQGLPGDKTQEEARSGGDDSDDDDSDDDDSGDGDTGDDDAGSDEDDDGDDE